MSGLRLLAMLFATAFGWSAIQGAASAMEFVIRADDDGLRWIAVVLASIPAPTARRALPPATS